MQFLAHGMSVIAGWDGTEDLSALAAFVRSLGRQDCGRDEFNVVIAVSGDALEDDALTVLRRFRARLVRRCASRAAIRRSERRRSTRRAM